MSKKGLSKLDKPCYIKLLQASYALASEHSLFIRHTSYFNIKRYI